MITSYFQLVRFPGIFTAFTNIFVGFFLVNPSEINWYLLSPLLISSGFLFLAGMSLNDYFDYRIDKKERPRRPLPSGKISRRNALYISISFLVFANVSSFFVGTQTILLTLIMTSLIVFYDIKSKNLAYVGIFNLSIIRFLNVILGTSVVPFDLEFTKIAIPIAIFVAGISILAKTEMNNTSSNAHKINIIFIIVTIISVFIITYDKGYIYLSLIVLFSVFVFFPIIKNKINSKQIQKIITYQLMAIILLDSALIMAFAEIEYALMALSLIIPSFIISKKLYVT